MLLLAGMLFGSGLAIAGMTEPTRVLGFLDIFGTWDPTLAFVMGGGVAVTLPGFAVLMRQSRPGMHCVSNGRRGVMSMHDWSSAARFSVLAGGWRDFAPAQPLPDW